MLQAARTCCPGTPLACPSTRTRTHYWDKLQDVSCKAERTARVRKCTTSKEMFKPVDRESAEIMLARQRECMAAARPVLFVEDDIFLSIPALI